jgi:hypothetical protein
VARRIVQFRDGHAQKVRRVDALVGAFLTTAGRGFLAELPCQTFAAKPSAYVLAYKGL